MKKYLKQLKENKKGFTLIEMIVVIAIIGILAAILVPSMAGYLKTARDSQKEANAKTIYTAAQAAVTSLEVTTTPVEDGTYDLTPGTTKNAELGNKIKGLIGEKNYAKLTKLEVKVEKSAVTEITVEDASGEAKYPQESISTSTDKDENLS